MQGQQGVPLVFSWCLCSSSVYSFPLEEPVTQQNKQSATNQLVLFVVALVLLHIVALVSPVASVLIYLSSYFMLQ